jgi:hypothetical protein
MSQTDRAQRKLDRLLRDLVRRCDKNLEQKRAQKERERKQSRD